MAGVEAGAERVAALQVCSAWTRHLVSVSVLLFGSCHLILRRVRQPLWEGVQEKYWPNKVTSGASISQEKAN